MDEINVLTSFNPLDALESISKIYNSKQLAKVELLKLQAQIVSFDQWLSKQMKENRERRSDLLIYTESYRKQIERIIDKIIEDPEITVLYKAIFEGLLKANNELALRISEIKIQSK